MALRDRRIRARRGSTLVEALVAMVIVGTSAAAVAALASETLHAVRRAQASDVEARRASAFLDIVALWPREELDLRLGDRAQGEWRLRIGRPHRTLYVVTLLDSTGVRPLLATALYRPDTTRSEGPDGAW